MTEPKLHEARLVGSYHAYKVAGDDVQYKQWCNSLPLGDRSFIHRYILRSEWGRLDQGEFDRSNPDDYITIVNGIGIQMNLAMESFRRSGAEASESLANVFNSLGLAIVGGMESAISPTFMEELRQGREQAAREDLMAELRYWRIPPGGAQWLAERWPAQFLSYRIEEGANRAWYALRLWIVKRLEWLAFWISKLSEVMYSLAERIDQTL